MPLSIAYASPEERTAAFDEARSWLAGEMVPARFALWFEHEGLCHICWCPVRIAELHFEHVVPLERGGTWDDSNIAPAHPVCNYRKGTKLMQELSDWSRRGP